jgi:hypothetical protein
VHNAASSSQLVLIIGSLVVANGLLWLLRAALHHEPALLVSNVLSGSMALVVLGALSRTHPRQAVLELLGVLASVAGVAAAQPETPDRARRDRPRGPLRHVPAPGVDRPEQRRSE